MKKRLLRLAVVVSVLVALVVVTLALPVDPWRTGRLAVTPLELAAGDRFAGRATRIWIDTDAACGADRRVDPDDCFAILALLNELSVEVVGLSTVFGNAPLELTDATTRELVQRITANRAPVAVHRGSANPGTPNAPAHDALRAALDRAPLTIIALGPLTNVAAALRLRPDLQRRVARIIAVMGRRPGHVFHPTEGRGGAMLFGHGPIFRDLNFVSDPDAAAQIIRMSVPLTLVPYDAAREVELSATHLERMRNAGGASAWLAESGRPWLDFWREDVGREGFYPFDLVASAFAMRPSLLQCARVPIRAGEDIRFRWPFRERRALLAGPDAILGDAPGVIGTALYCPQASNDLQMAIDDWL